MKTIFFSLFTALLLTACGSEESPRAGDTKPVSGATAAGSPATAVLPPVKAPEPPPPPGGGQKAPEIPPEQLAKIRAELEAKMKESAKSQK